MGRGMHGMHGRARIDMGTLSTTVQFKVTNQFCFMLYFALSPPCLHCGRSGVAYLCSMYLDSYSTYVELSIHQRSCVNYVVAEILIEVKGLKRRCCPTTHLTVFWSPKKKFVGEKGVAIRLGEYNMNPFLPTHLHSCLDAIYLAKEHLTRYYNPNSLTNILPNLEPCYNAYTPFILR